MTRSEINRRLGQSLLKRAAVAAATAWVGQQTAPRPSRTRCVQPHCRAEIPPGRPGRRCPACREVFGPA